ncbi:alpha/beta hydrolase [Leptospira haakeii]|uniref:Alpha/beta hydrolase n=1 Tax=Leptospira haakeii TaxID=2023198 RepID=A0ABX4PIV8_9LEPT|nr:alpha/beta hydrolase [Leptospira haakeii]PKA14323.1 alpha/beta hydrolase [Leptospira haakeii]PKA18181.1 alpha/beta hydrolase [Leptospira haakeii]
MKNIYLISGLGADERVFRNIDFYGENPKHIRWIDPYIDESLESYSKRLLNQIDSKNELILIGVSFGGIIASEIAKHVPAKKIIVISSIKDSSEIPFIYRIINFLGLMNLIPSYLLKLYNPILAYFFGISSLEDKELLKSFLSKTDGKFIKWALKSILMWNNENYPSNLVHIHGSDDRLFPRKLIGQVAMIAGGGHFMILNKAEEISVKLREILKD